MGWEWRIFSRSAAVFEPLLTYLPRDLGVAFAPAAENSTNQPGTWTSCRTDLYFTAPNLALHGLKVRSFEMPEGNSAEESFQVPSLFDLEGTQLDFELKREKDRKKKSGLRQYKKAELNNVKIKKIIRNENVSSPEQPLTVRLQNYLDDDWVPGLECQINHRCTESHDNGIGHEPKEQLQYHPVRVQKRVMKRLFEGEINGRTYSMFNELEAEISELQLHFGLGRPSEKWFTLSIEGDKELVKAKAWELLGKLGIEKASKLEKGLQEDLVIDGYPGFLWKRAFGLDSKDWDEGEEDSC
eukprot:TRINITY_DN95043_c0_g1_i1.p1 TRINITY_DN95043_c0_g1~~TRINITY_DN95043_c0_g1_i1.p1  ORF type:complete len:298 (+),score=47.37 TRINITY_DN95043_c0_g1_i1:78-971(+)